MPRAQTTWEVAGIYTSVLIVKSCYAPLSRYIPAPASAHESCYPCRTSKSACSARRTRVCCAKNTVSDHEPHTPVPCLELQNGPSHNPTHNCLHIPQGLAGGDMSVATPSALNMPILKPPAVLVTALPKATRSAQVPTGYAAFSTLAPSMYSPSSVRIDAPTRN